MLLNIPEIFASNVLPSQQATFTPVFSGCPLRTAVRFGPDSHGDLALPWDPVHVKFHVHLFIFVYFLFYYYYYYYFVFLPSLGLLLRHMVPRLGV